MKKYIYKVRFLYVIFFSGCFSSAGYKISPSNGKYYYFPENCEKVRPTTNDPDLLECGVLNEFGNITPTGVRIRPANQQQINNYFREEEADQRALENFNQTIQNTNNNIQMQQLNNNLNKINNTLRYGY